jgi:hypothetical protein
MEIIIGYSGTNLVATKGDDSINLPAKMAFLIGAGPQRIDAAFNDAMKGKYPMREEELKIIRRWMR